MKPLVAAVLIFLFFGAFNCPLHPQKVNLAELQKKEKERRKKTKKSKYIITNDNIDKIEIKQKKPYSFIKMGEGKKGKKSSAAAGKKPGAAKAGKSPDLPGSEEGASKTRMTEEAWRQRKIDLLIRINSLKKNIDDMQSEFNRAGNFYPDETLNQQLQRRQAAQKLLEQINKGKEQLKKLEKDLDNLETEARQLGVPPGWLRVDPDDLESKKAGEKKGN